MTSAEGCSTPLDPRIRRTRQTLQEALGKLLETESFDNVSVQDIAEAATVNRATFYDHYADKYALLEALVASRFFGLLKERNIRFDGTCSYAIGALILAVCDYLVQTRAGCGKRANLFEPLIESTVISLIREVLLDGLRKHSLPGRPTPPMVATTASWAIYGAVKEWSSTPDRARAEEVVETIMSLVSPILQKGLPLDNL